MPSHAAPATPDAGLDATLPSQPGDLTGGGALTAYATRAGTLLGTPMYMAPEQITGAAPDQLTEVFSVGVLAHEIISGKPPYAARTLDDLFAEITRPTSPRLGDAVPAPVAAVVERALAHDREARFPSMAALRDALVATRDRMFRPARPRWPWLIAAIAVLAATAVALGLWWSRRTPPHRPGDSYVTRALDEYDVFYGSKALSSLRAALRVDPEHPRALAYVVLFGGTDADRADAVAHARSLVGRLPGGKDRTLLDAVIALEDHGPAAARDVLAAGGDDYELRFWAAELAFRAGAYPLALPVYRELYRAGARRFRGRIFDHYSAVLLWADDPAAALEVGERYHQAYPGEPDAVGVHATTLAAAGRLDEAVTLAEEAVTLNRSEDTLAGLAKVRALRGELGPARELYAESLASAPPARRPLRRAALALLAWMERDDQTAAAAVAPCLPGGADAGRRERGACLLVAAIVTPPGGDTAATALAELDRLAGEATPTRPAYGDPRALAALVRAHTRFDGGGCLRAPEPASPPPPPEQRAELERELGVPLDFYAAYHLPFFATWAVCERAALAAATGDRARAAAVLAPVAERAPGRWWLLDDLAAVRGR